MTDRDRDIGSAAEAKPRNSHASQSGLMKISLLVADDLQAVMMRYAGVCCVAVCWLSVAASLDLQPDQVEQLVIETSSGRVRGERTESDTGKQVRI